MMKFFLAKTKNDKFQKTFKGFSRLLTSKALFTNMGFRLKNPPETEYIILPEIYTVLWLYEAFIVRNLDTDLKQVSETYSFMSWAKEILGIYRIYQF